MDLWDEDLCLMQCRPPTNSSGILVAIDFENAYDSVTHDFLFEVSEKF